MSVTFQDETAEAIAGGLHASGFEHTGDRDRTIGFRRDTNLYAVRVGITKRLDGYVRTTVAYPVLIEGAGLAVATITFDINTAGDHAAVREATTKVVTRTLVIYRDVLKRGL